MNKFESRVNQPFWPDVLALDDEFLAHVSKQSGNGESRDWCDARAFENITKDACEAAVALR